ncbi:TVP38/TMEM64 family protein [Streptococcus moroccensis]|uniref:TVP38/TMEM64 family membrane protein n=1 Tax=Streptococcus moroccensis TaxID=1451356 RepID=A0ABT9YQ20_9STRE|nr:TVP38/TMEM64 family protein [Streptococcus moroccensis]MDQ0221691.1 putative membrane protein YdjX (TVP38/TMEM64 family) [Streptococcus moroccensis]
MYRFWQKTFKVLGILALIASFIVVIVLYKNGILNDQNAMKDWAMRYPLIAPFAFFLIQVVQVVFPIIPGGVTTVVGFLIFKPILAFFINSGGIIVGSLILFHMARTYGKKFCLLFMSEETFYKYEQKIDNKRGFEIFFILCMISPMAPADIVVMITGLTSMSYRRFFMIILLCRPVSIVVYSYLLINGGEWLQRFLLIK